MDVFELNADIELMMLKPTSDEVTSRLVRVRMRKELWPANELIPVGVTGWYGRNAWIPSDCPYFEHLSPICLSAFARYWLGPLLAKSGYFVETNLDVRGPYKMFFAETILNAFDVGKSEVTRFSTGNVFQVSRYELITDAIVGHDIFMLNDQVSRVFVTDNFVDVVNRHNLIGFDLVKIWSSETGSEEITTFKRGLETVRGERKSTILAKQAAAMLIIESRHFPE